MTDDHEVPDSEEQEVEVAEHEEYEEQEVVETPRTVPLEALEAERRKRQELEFQMKALQQSQSKPQQEEDEDDDELMTRAEYKRRRKQDDFAAKREFLEEAFCQSNPQAIELINTHLEEVIKRKPWLAQTIETAPNRFARAYEIVQDYAPIVQKKMAPTQKLSDPKVEAKRIVENSQKPGNPATIAKSANTSNSDYLRSIAGKPEFREYRKKMLAGG